MLNDHTFFNYKPNISKIILMDCSFLVSVLVIFIILNILSSVRHHNRMDPRDKQQAAQIQSKCLTLREAQERLRTFVKERDWEQFHTPRNLVMALVGEVGEVAEVFQWKGEVAEGLPSFSEAQRKHVGQELADVFSYLIRLADVCHVDLAEAFTAKMEKNARKYPKDMVKGSAKKYTEYKHNWKNEE